MTAHVQAPRPFCTNTALHNHMHAVTSCSCPGPGPSPPPVAPWHQWTSLSASLPSEEGRLPEGKLTEHSFCRQQGSGQEL